MRNQLIQKTYRRVCNEINLNYFLPFLQRNENPLSLYRYECLTYIMMQSVFFLLNFFRFQRKLYKEDKTSRWHLWTLYTYLNTETHLVRRASIFGYAQFMWQLYPISLKEQFRHWHCKPSLYGCKQISKMHT